MVFTMQTRVETLPNYRVAYVRQTGPYGPANVQAMEKLKGWAARRNLLTESAILLGVPQDDPAATPPEACRFDACIVLADDVPADDTVAVAELPGGEYMVCLIRHTAEEVRKAWAELIPAIRSGGYRIDEGKPILERYSGEMILNEWCEICVPLKLS